MEKITKLLAVFCIVVSGIFKVGMLTLLKTGGISPHS
jgi:hypothetical protein